MVGGPQTEKGEGVVANSDSGKAPAISDSDRDDQKSEGEKPTGKDDDALEEAAESAEALRQLGLENESAAKLMAATPENQTERQQAQQTGPEQPEEPPAKKQRLDVQAGEAAVSDLAPHKLHTQILQDRLSQMSLLPIEDSGGFESLSEIRYNTSRIRSFSIDGDIERMKVLLETQFEMIIQLTASLKTAVRDLQGQSKKHTAAMEKREKEKQERQIEETMKLVEAQELAARKRITQLKAAATMNIDWQAVGHTAFPTYADEAAATAAAVTNKQE